MPKLFGEFLVDKKIISSSELLEALVEQIEELPSTASLLLQSKMLSDDQILDAFKVQAEDGVSLIGALKKLNTFSEELQKFVNKATTEKRKPLGRILIEKKKIVMQQLIHLLDDFVYESGDAIAETRQTNRTDQEGDKTISAMPFVESVADATFQSNGFHTIDENLLRQFLNSFGESALQAINAAAEDHDQDKGELAKEFLYEIIAASRFIGMQLIQKTSEVLLSHLDEKQPKTPKLLAGAAILSTLRDELAKERTEKKFWNNPESQKKFLNFIGSNLTQSEKPFDAHSSCR